jgi:hypothetical protein
MNRQRRALLATFVLTPLTLPMLGAAPAAASIIETMDLDALTAAADRIVVGEVVSVTSAWDRARRQILSTIDVQVAELWKGRAPGAGRVRIVQLGGTVDGIEMKVHGLARFRAGERAVLFLGDASTTSSFVVGLGQGRRPLRFDAAARRWMADGGDRSAAVAFGPGGRLEHASPEAPLPLDELRTRVRRLVQP